MPNCFAIKYLSVFTFGFNNFFLFELQLGFKGKSGEITESVYAFVVVKSLGQNTVFSTVNGIINKIKVFVGQ